MCFEGTPATPLKQPRDGHPREKESEDDQRQPSGETDIFV